MKRRASPSWKPTSMTISRWRASASDKDGPLRTTGRSTGTQFRLRSGSCLDGLSADPPSALQAEAIREGLQSAEFLKGQAPVIPMEWAYRSTERPGGPAGITFQRTAAGQTASMP